MTSFQDEEFEDSLENFHLHDDEENRENFEPFVLSRPPRPIAFGYDFVSLNEKVNNEIEEEDFVNPFERNSKFKLPERLAARLFKKQSCTKKSDVNVLQNLGNIRPCDSVPVIGRETMVVRKKTRPSMFLNNFEAENIKDKLNETMVINNNNSNNVLQNTIDTEADDLRYATWINSVIATSFKIENVNVDLTRVINDCIVAESAMAKNRNVKVSQAPKGPLKDGISSMAYREEKLMSNLREKASKLFEDSNMKMIEEILLVDLNSERFFIRKDKSIHADVGAKKHILEVLLNYNPLWLKIALETVFGHIIERSSKSEMHTLIQFLTRRLLSFKDMASKKNCKNVTTYFMNDNNVKKAKQHILFHFLLIVNFLDVAKRKRLIDHDPCLFRTDAELKSSRDIVASFSRDYITGVGDIFKALRNVGIHLAHQQNPIEEFNFTVTKLSNDLRCGVRLGRLAEIMLLRNDILPQLQFPPTNLSRKRHNVELVLKFLRPLIGDLPNVPVRDICNGIRAKTTLLLDHLINAYSIRQREVEFQREIDRIIQIQRFWRQYLATKEQRQYFIKLRATAIQMQRQFRAIRQAKKDRSEFINLKNATIQIQRKFRAVRQMKQDRKDFMILKSAAVLIQKHFRATREARLQRNRYLKLKNSAIAIQQRFRQNQLSKIQRQSYLQKRSASIKIQRWFKAHLQKQYYAKLRETTILVQRKFRANRLAKIQRKHYLQLRQATILFQESWRFILFYRKRTNAAIIVQRHFRAKLEMRRCRAEYLQVQRSVVTIQRWFRGCLASKQERARFLELRKVAIVIQSKWRTHRQRHFYLQLRQSAIVVQQTFRAKLEMRRCRAEYLQVQRSVVTIQHWFRGCLAVKQERARFLELRQAAIVIQSRWRGHRQRHQYLQQQQAAIILQKRYRAKLMMQKQRQYYSSIQKMSIFVQRRFRQNQQFKADRARYLQMKHAAVVIQRLHRARVQRRTFLNQRQAAMTIQTHFRAHREARFQREKYLQIRNAIIVLQRMARQYLRKRELTRVALVIQQRFRANRVMLQCRHEYLRKRQSTVVIQQHFRAWIVGRKQRQHYLEIRQAAICIQNYYRKTKPPRFYYLVHEYTSFRIKAAIKIQSHLRGFLVRRSMDKKFIELPYIRSRLEYHSQNMTEDKKLISVVYRTLERICQTCSVNHISADYEKLAFATELSHVVCEAISSELIVERLIDTFQSLNRSEPHKTIIVSLLTVLINLSKKTDIKIIYESTDLLTALIKLIRNFPKINNIILNTLELLLCLLQKRKSVLRNLDQHSKDTLKTFVYKNSREVFTQAKSAMRQTQSSKLKKPTLNSFSKQILALM